MQRAAAGRQAGAELLAWADFVAAETWAAAVVAVVLARWLCGRRVLWADKG